MLCSGHAWAANPITVTVHEDNLNAGVRKEHRTRLGPSVVPRLRRSLTSTGESRLLVILYSTSDTTALPPDPAQIAALVFGATDSVAAFYAEASFGKLQLTGDVVGPYTVSPTPIPAGFPSGICLDANQAALDAAVAAGVNPGNYDLGLFVMNRPYCAGMPPGWGSTSMSDPPTGPFVSSFDGLHWYPVETSIVNAQELAVLGWVSARHTISHELGHQLPPHWWHAGRIGCTQNGVLVPVGGTCTLYEYGSPFEVMGNLHPPRHPTAFHKRRMGWITDANVVTVTQSGTYRLEPIERATTGIQLLRIAKPPLMWSMRPTPPDAVEYYYVDFRQSWPTVDAFTPGSGPVLGPAVYIGPDWGVKYWGGYDTANLSALASGSSSTLPAGATFRDSTNGIAITTMAVDSAGATVQIALGNVPLPPAPPPPMPVPTVWISSPNDGARVRQRATVSLAATVTDTTSLAWRYQRTGSGTWITLPSASWTVPSGKNIVYTIAVTATGPGGTASASVRVRSR